MKTSRIVMDNNSISSRVKQIACSVITDLKRTDYLAIIGIHTRGVFLAQRLINELNKSATFKNKKIDFGTLDIVLYRDDIGTTPNQPDIKETQIEFDITGKTVLLVDDVLYTGRSIRAAIDQIMDFGRPKRVLLAVLIDRGLRELPIQADYIGKKIRTLPEETVSVNLTEVDGKNEVVVVKKKM